MSVYIVKYRYAIVTFLLLSTSTHSQQVYLEVGGASTKFKNYVNSLGENSLDESYKKSYALFLETGVRFKIIKDKLHLNLGISHNNYKIHTGFYSGQLSIPLSYDLTYFALKSGISILFVKKGKFKLQGHAHLSSDWLISGTSAYEDVVNNVYKDKTIARSLLRYHRGLSAVYTLSKKTSLYLNYNLADSCKQTEGHSTSSEKYSLHTNAFSFGILVRLQKVKTI